MSSKQNRYASNPHLITYPNKFKKSHSQFNKTLNDIKLNHPHTTKPTTNPFVYIYTPPHFTSPTQTHTTMYSEEDEAFDLAQLVRDYLEPPESFHYVSTKSSKASDLKHQSTCLSVKVNVLIWFYWVFEFLFWFFVTHLQEIVSEHTEKELEIEEKVSDHLESLAKTVPFVNEQKKHLVTKLKMDGYNALLCNTG